MRNRDLVYVSNAPFTEVSKVLSAFSTPKLTKPLSVTDAKKAGFTILKKVGKGEYERQ